ncbi:MAG: glycosyltransferase, partial [Acidobacteria bacterium]|nr:glycosyltransferase [Acidobacteriota bacterium]
MKASVLIKTFNHERFVETTLASVLMQRTGFEWEIVVSDDASSDGTAAALRRIAAANPTRVRVIERSTNLGPVRNFIETLGACRGEYVALLDGDDYWTARDKLASQVAWLDERREYGASTHDAVRVDALGRETGDRYCSSKLPERLTLERILRGNPRPRLRARVSPGDRRAPARLVRGCAVHRLATARAARAAGPAPLPAGALGGSPRSRRGALVRHARRVTVARESRAPSEFRGARRRRVRLADPRPDRPPSAAARNGARPRGRHL